MRQRIGLIIATTIAGMLLATSAFAQAPTTPAPTTPPAPTAPSAPATPTTTAPETKKVTRPTVTIETEKGKIVIELHPEDAPKTADNFAKLVEKGFYNGLTFHRVEPGFVIQGGDPKGDGTGGPGYTIPDELNKTLTHEVGAVAMAKSPQPNSAGSQFYIVIGKPAHFLDFRYTVFGKVISGQDVAEKIAVGDKMTKVTIVEPDPATAPPAASTPPAPKITAPAELKNPVQVNIPYFTTPKTFKNTKPRVKVSIDAEGKVTKVDIKEGTGIPEMDKAIKDTFAKSVWTPAYKDGVAIKSDRTFIYDVLNSSRRYE